MLKIKIKASDITNLTDARYFAAKEVEWLCFNFSEGAVSYIDPMKARAIFEWVEGPKIVGEFDNATADEINFYTEGWGLQVIQVGFLMPIDTVKAIKNTPIIKDIWIEEFTNPDFLVKELTAYAPHVESFQLNFDKNGITWADLKLPNAMIRIEDLKDICERFNIVLSIDFQPAMLDEILELNLYGLTVKGGEEERIGVKSYDELDEILDAIVETEY